jgi:hypothetical protein
MRHLPLDVLTLPLPFNLYKKVVNKCSVYQVKVRGLEGISKLDEWAFMCSPLGAWSSITCCFDKSDPPMEQHMKQKLLISSHYRVFQD